MTFVSAIFALIATPLLRRAIAGKFMPVDPIQMMFLILNMIVIPVIASLMAHEVFYSNLLWV